MPHLAVIIATIALCYGGVSVGRVGVIPSSVFMAILAGVVAIIEWRTKPSPMKTVAWGVLIALFLTVSDYRRAQMSLLNFEYSGILVAGIALAAFFAVSKIVSLSHLLWPLIALSTIAAGLAGFAEASGGKLLFGDDHAPFLYRLIQLREQFPFIPFYNPMWNAGVEAREFFPSGTLGFFALFMPVWYLFDPTDVYSWAVATLLFVVLPVSILLSCRITGVLREATWIAVSLSAASSLLWYRWALSYGTIGFITSMTLLPLALCSGARMFRDSKPSWRLIALFVFSSSLVVFWPLGTVFLAPLAVEMIANGRKVIRSRRLIVTFAALAVVHLPWMVIFAAASGVFRYLTTGVRPGDSVAHVRDMVDAPYLISIARALRSQAVSSLPILVVPGCLALCRAPAEIRRTLIAAAALILVLGAFVAPIAPHLELDRALVALPLLLLIPIASLLDVALLHHRGSSVQKIAAAGATALILVAPLIVYRVASNRTVQRFHWADQTVDEVATAIRAHAGSGRTLFAGFTLHELSGGHVAPLAAFTGLPLIAMSYQHNVWTYTDVIPDQFRLAGDDGVFKYLDLFNVTLVVTHDKNWRKWFDSRPNAFHKVSRSGRFTFFKRTTPAAGYFQEGAGEVLEQSGNAVRFRLTQPDAVLKFRYHLTLDVDGCGVTQSTVAAGIDFTKLSGCPTDRILEMRSTRSFQRLVRR